MKSLITLSLLCLLTITTIAQGVAVDSLVAISKKMKDDNAKAEVLIAISRGIYNVRPEEGHAYAIQALKLSEKLHYLEGKAQALKFAGLSNYKQGKLLDALEDYNAAMKVFDSLNDKLGKANILSNIGAMYIEQGDEEKALENLLKSLAISEEQGDKLRIATAMINIGAIYINKPSNYDKALDYFTHALQLSTDIDNKPAISTALVNIGETYFNKGIIDSALYYFNKSLNDAEDDETICYSLIMMGNTYLKGTDLDNALSYFSRAYQIASKAGKKLEMTKALIGIGNAYMLQFKHAEALKTFAQAEALAREINSTFDLKEIYQGFAEAHAQNADFQKAFYYQGLLNNIKDTIYNIQTDQKLSNLQLDFEIQKKEAQINLLTKDKELQSVDLKRQKFAKNSAIIGLALLLIIAFILYRSYKMKIETNKLLDHQKDEIEKLLLNILPAEVARELQETGRSTPRYYEKVSVLFTDFKSFSKLADHLSPQEVIEELNDYFTAFDAIIEKYHLEKIKTIGDAYMCAGGIPVQDDDHTINMIRASLEIQAYIEKKNIDRRRLGKPEWDLRIGIHTGPIVAGVVGNKKYAYDIWGSTVNIANRMESNGEPGQVNISSTTYQLVKDQYSCTYRGKISAKNIGEVDMYFVDHEKGEVNNYSIIKGTTKLQGN